MKVQFTVPGEPVGKGRPRFNTHSGRAFTPEKTVNYENLVALEYDRQVKDSFFKEGQMIKMKITAYFGIAKSVAKKYRPDMLEGKIRPVKKPDMDNIIKVIADALNKLAYYDDSQIVSTTINKYYAEQPHVDVEIESVEE